MIARVTLLVSHKKGETGLLAMQHGDLGSAKVCGLVGAWSTHLRSSLQAGRVSSTGLFQLPLRCQGNLRAHEAILEALPYREEVNPMLRV